MKKKKKNPSVTEKNIPFILSTSYNSSWLQCMNPTTSNNMYIWLIFLPLVLESLSLIMYTEFDLHE